MTGAPLKIKWNIQTIFYVLLLSVPVNSQCIQPLNMDLPFEHLTSRLLPLLAINKTAAPLPPVRPPLPPLSAAHWDTTIWWDWLALVRETTGVRQGVLLHPRLSFASPELLSLLSSPHAVARETGIDTMSESAWISFVCWAFDLAGNWDAHLVFSVCQIHSRLIHYIV